jgi:hypothetical protein
MSEKILLLSYFSGIDGNCPAEWVDDKLDSLGKLDKEVVLISGVGSRKDHSPHVIHYRIPSLSLTDFRSELAELKAAGHKIPYSMCLMFPLAWTFGFLFDQLQKRFAGGFGGGKWSWFIPALACALFASPRHRCRKIFTTGGPASAHLVGVLVSKLYRKKCVVELQDPLSGADIGRNSRSAKMLAMVEGIICRNADKMVYVTKQAAVAAGKRFPGCRIEHVYPGAKRFLDLDTPVSKKRDGAFRLVHLGTLYSTRNLNTLIEAIELLICRGLIHSKEIEVHNLGEIYGEIRDEHLAKSYIKQFPIRPRMAAIREARKYDASLLIQHTDERSKLTMPYKTYDYLNIGNPILALTNNLELNGMMSSLGHFSVEVSDVERIASTLLKLMKDKQSGLQSPRDRGFDPVEQCHELLEF